MNGLSPVVGRLLALALLAAAALGAWVGIVEPVTARFAEHDRTIEQSRDLLSRHIRIAHERQQLEAQLAALRVSRAATGRLIEGDSFELTAADVQNRLKTLADNSGAELKSTQILPAEDLENFRKVAVRVTMMANAEAAQSIFYALETATPYLFLDRLDLRGPKRRSRRKRKNEGILQLRFDVFGYMRIGTP